MGYLTARDVTECCCRVIDRRQRSKVDRALLSQKACRMLHAQSIRVHTASPNHLCVVVSSLESRLQPGACLSLKREGQSSTEQVHTLSCHARMVDLLVVWPDLARHGLDAECSVGEGKQQLVGLLRPQLACHRRRQLHRLLHIIHIIYCNI